MVLILYKLGKFEKSELIVKFRYLIDLDQQKLTYFLQGYLLVIY